jgi:hypothetical protein
MFLGHPGPGARGISWARSEPPRCKVVWGEDGKHQATGLEEAKQPPIGLGALWPGVVLALRPEHIAQAVPMGDDGGRCLAVHAHLAGLINREVDHGLSGQGAVRAGRRAEVQQELIRRPSVSYRVDQGSAVGFSDTEVHEAGGRKEVLHRRPRRQGRPHRRDDAYHCWSPRAGCRSASSAYGKHTCPQCARSQA